MLSGSVEGKNIPGNGPSHGGDMSQEGVSILQHVSFSIHMIHPFMSMSNYGDTLWLQTSTLILAPPL